MLEETVYLDRNNTIDLSIANADTGITINHAAFTKIQVEVGETVIDSAANPEFFDLTNQDKLILKFGQTTLLAGKYTAWLVIFDADNTDGLVIGKLTIIVRDTP